MENAPDAPTRLTLAEASTKTPLLLIAARTNPSVTRRLATHGLRPGAQITLLNRTAGGGRVVSVEGVRIALDRSILEELDVEVAQ